MNRTSVKDVQRALVALSPTEIEELYLWFEQNYPNPIAARLQSDLAAGRLDSAIDRAL
jgi:hypothetical protein